MPWVVIGLVVGLIAVGAGLAAVLIARRRNPASSQASPEVAADQWLALGIIFMAASVALMVSLGPAMVGIVVLGIIYMGMGARIERQEGDDEHEGST